MLIIRRIFYIIQKNTKVLNNKKEAKKKESTHISQEAG